MFEHGEGAANGWGENLSALSGTDNDIRAGIVLWEDEEPDYDPSNPVASHFTQVSCPEQYHEGLEARMLTVSMIPRCS